MNVLQSEIGTKQNQKEMMRYISEAYPSLYIFMLKQFNMSDRLEKYVAQCKEYEDDAEKYSLYIHGYWLVWLDR